MDGAAGGGGAEAWASSSGADASASGSGADASASGSGAEASPTNDGGPGRGPGSGPGLAPEPVDDVLAALADPTRRRLLDLISARGTASATELAGGLPVTRQAVVKHLAVLDAAGLVTGRRLGREVRYEVRSAALDATARWMASLAADWDRRLARIKAVAEAAEAAEAAAREESR